MGTRPPSLRLLLASPLSHPSPSHSHTHSLSLLLTFIPLLSISYLHLCRLASTCSHYKSQCSLKASSSMGASLAQAPGLGSSLTRDPLPHVFPLLSVLASLSFLLCGYQIKLKFIYFCFLNNLF